MYIDYHTMPKINGYEVEYFFIINVLFQQYLRISFNEPMFSQTYRELQPIVSFSSERTPAQHRLPQALRPGRK